MPKRGTVAYEVGKRILQARLTCQLKQVVRAAGLIVRGACAQQRPSREHDAYLAPTGEARAGLWVDRGWRNPARGEQLPAGIKPTRSEALYRGRRARRLRPIGSIRNTRLRHQTTESEE